MTDDYPTGPLPLDEVHTPTLDLWRRDGQYRADDGWINWVEPDAEFRVGVEAVELLNTDADRLVTAFEVTLWVVAGDRPYDERLRETIMNSRLAVLAADAVADRGEWDEGLAPRPKDADR